MLFCHESVALGARNRPSTATAVTFEEPNVRAAIDSTAATETSNRFAAQLQKTSTARSGRHAFRGSPFVNARAVSLSRTPPLDALVENRLQDPPSVGKRSEVALPVDPPVLVARHLDDPEAGPERLDAQLGLDLEPVRVEVERRKHALPERHVAVAEIREAAAEEQPDEQDEPAVAEPSEQ